eukprot:scaffold21510_cov35-Attheya_sp.AAC.1
MAIYIGLHFFNPRSPCGKAANKDLFTSIVDSGANITNFLYWGHFYSTSLFYMLNADSPHRSSKEALIVAERTTETFVWALSMKQSPILAVFAVMTGHNCNFKLS